MTNREQRTRPRVSIDRIAIPIALLTIMVGQVLMMKEMGLVSGVAELYSVTVGVLMAYIFKPQLEYAFLRIMDILNNRFQWGGV